ncbi:FAD-binding oxidoreductase [Steroidobacter agaridevorans]|uniref:FAD-binding oxidoreductase n=1 Tax=Steroidobacter agaridevorans TaxID=2695856 RepID=UPI00132885E1|nr:FAD-binding oxidoreductase [Steroidobacter agaridevorans]GFE86295.1 L-gulonolactone oxidase [Steroidobacter agaridevorans]
MSALATFESREEHREVCNDKHSHLNSTSVLGRIAPRAVEDVVRAVRHAEQRGQSLSVAGSCHAMGGQQFATDAWLLDMRSMDKVLGFDRERGIIHAQAGITWPDLIRHYVIAQRGGASAWGIRQKQTGADRLTLGGAVAANIHGRGLAYAPFVNDIESVEVVRADGSVVECSRAHNYDLFRLVVGGYGLFGVVTSVKLRLAPRQKVERVVELARVEQIIERFQERIDAGYLYGDFQFSSAPEDRGFLSHGVFSCYRPVDPDTPIPSGQIRLSPADWRRLLYLAHRNKLQAFNEFADFYLQSSGQIYWSDTHQLSVYLDDYHGKLDDALQPQVAGSEMITELYVPREQLAAFMQDVRKDFLRHRVDFIYGTVRLIEPDTETFMAWARERFACVIFNLHVDHDARGLTTSAEAFRRLIDIAIDHGGSYFLTYHRHASLGQLRTCYPMFDRFLAAKRSFDPQELFQSDWYRHYRDELARMP